MEQGGGGNKGVDTFLRSISPKMNVIARPEFELTTMSQSRTLDIMQRGRQFWGGVV